MDELIHQIQAEFAGGASSFKIRTDLFSIAFGSTQDNGLQTIANLIALSNGWRASVSSEWVTFTPAASQPHIDFKERDAEQRAPMN